MSIVVGVFAGFHILLLYFVRLIPNKRKEVAYERSYAGSRVVASVSADAFIKYTYPNANCTGTPTIAEGSALNKCNLLYKNTVSGNTVTQSTYSSQNCGGSTTTSVTFTTGVCNADSVGLTSVQYATGSSFNPAPGAGDTVEANYFASGCGGSPSTATVSYGTTTGRSGCQSISIGGFSASSQTISGDSAPFPNSAATFSAGVFAVVALFALLF